MKLLVHFIALIIGLSWANSSYAVDATRAIFGTMADGTVIESVTLTSSDGISARIITYGATLQSLLLPDRSGRLDDVVLGYPDLARYLSMPQYFGSTVGRFANRIAGARFSLDGTSYSLAANDSVNSLHGGNRGFDKVVWTVAEVTSGSVASVRLAYVSPDGDEGYPGTLDVSVVYSLDETGTLTTSYEATTDKPTIVNLTHHSLFNLSGMQSMRTALGQHLMVNADAFTPVDATLIPTGEIRAVANTPFDFRDNQEIGARIRDAGDAQIVIGRGYDHNFVLNGGRTDEPKLAARLADPISGRVLELFTTEPGLQVYSGNFLNGTVAGKGNRIYRQGDGLALEPQAFPDTPNRPEFPSARLDPGETYRQVSYYRFSIVEE